MNHAKHFRILLAGLITLAACGKQEPDAARGGLGRIGGGTDDSLNTQVQSSGGLSCSATPSVTAAAYGQVFTVTVRVSGAQGGITISNTNYVNVTGQTTFTFNSSFAGSGATTVTVPVQVRDSKSVVTCKYQIALH